MQHRHQTESDVLVCNGKEAYGTAAGPVGDVRLPAKVFHVVHYTHELELMVRRTGIPCGEEVGMP